MASSKGIYKRGNTWWIRYAGSDGKIRFESTKSARKKDAEMLLVQRKKDVMEDNDPSRTKLIEKHYFKDFAKDYLVWAERQRSYDRKKDLVNLLVRTFGNVVLTQFNTRVLEEYQSKLLSENKAPATANRRIATIKHMFTKALEWEMVSEEVHKRVKKVKLLAENNRRLRYLSQDECRALINSCAIHLKPIVLMALNTGMRKGEILSLKWENIDLQNGFILLAITKNGERREIPINTTLKITLKKITRRLDTPYVFHDANNGKPFQDIKKSFYTACKKAGIIDFKFHDLRHTFASHLVMSGIDIKFNRLNSYKIKRF